MARNQYTPPLNTIETIGVSKRLLIIFIVDTSGSMRGTRIDAVNTAFNEMVPKLKKLQEEVGSEFDLYIAIMTFDQTAEWIVNPTPISEYNHSDIIANQWITLFSEAFDTLGEKLSRKEFFNCEGKIAQPYIMFMTDGYPTEEDDYISSLEELKQNGWFNSAQRFAVLIGEDAVLSSTAHNAVEPFVSNPREGIITAVDAIEIASAVQANTIHIVDGMTKHKINADDSLKDTRNNVNSYSDVSSPYGDTDNPYGSDDTDVDEDFVWD